tara:strand:- start:190 stop:357 length:168 start_codon:yes stop_codon:yes gene_type:complete
MPISTSRWRVMAVAARYCPAAAPRTPGQDIVAVGDGRQYQGAGQSDPAEARMKKK